MVLIGAGRSLSGGGQSDKKTVYAFNVEGGPWFDDGYLSGDIDAFRKKVRADDDKIQAFNYLSFANIVAMSWCPERVELIEELVGLNSGIKLQP